MKKVIFFDVDGVLLDWQHGFAEFVNHKRNGGRDIGRISKETFQRSKSYGLDDLGIWGPGEFIEDLAEFEQTIAFQHLKPLVSRQFLQMVANSGYSVQALTAGGGTSPSTRAARRFNLATHFGPVFDGVHFLEWKGDKTQFMLGYERSTGQTVTGIVEDKYEALVSAHDAGYNAYGITDFHNVDRQMPSTPSFVWFKDTKQFCIYFSDLSHD